MFFLADDRGYFREEGLDIEFTEGDTLANAVPKLMTGAFDAGYGTGCPRSTVPP
ncbi:ABC transporter substrate-binding protein [Variovorax sp. ZT4R33]|uniref:ABC transporter substrate-binding protein n=1 Tax=Variovorax sp. ZT4R33 TaxID=3443743 RepID=UPI003F461084